MPNCYNFTAQDVFTLPASTDKIFAAPDKLLVSSLTKLTLQLLDLGEKGAVTHSLDTQGVIENAEYCQANNHIATIEDGVLYVYESWWSDPRLKAVGNAKCFAWCQTSGRLVVFDGDKLTVFDDLIPSFEIDGIDDVEDVQLCEYILALKTAKFILVITFYDEKYKTDDDEIVWNFDRSDLIINVRSLASTPKLEKAVHSQIPEDFKEAYFPSRPIYGLNLRVKNLCNDATYQAKVILFKRLAPQFMQLVPYVNRSKKDTQNPLSPEKGELEYVTLYVGDAAMCELFSVLGPERRAKLELFETVESFAVDECFLHVLTRKSTLLTYAIPIPGFSKQWEPFPLSTHFMSMNRLMMSRDHLVVLSGRSSGDVTVYSLLKPTTSEFYADLVPFEDESVLQRAEDVVRLQVRLYGEACSERLLDLYRSIERAASPLKIHVLLEKNSRNSKLLKRALERAEPSELLNGEGFFTELGELLLAKYPNMLPRVLVKCNHISPKLLRDRIATATPEAATAISDYVCKRLRRIEVAKLHKKMLARNIPDWVYELPPFDGRGPDSRCRETDDCLCLRCSAGLLYAVIVLANAPSKIRHEHMFPKLPDYVPDVVKLACLLPLTKSSSANPADFKPVAGTIVKLVQKYTNKTQPEAPHLLTVLSDVLFLTDFLKCIPESSQSLLPWVQNGLMRERATKLKQEIVNLGSELRPLLP